MNARDSTALTFFQLWPLTSSPNLVCSGEDAVGNIRWNERRKKTKVGCDYALRDVPQVSFAVPFPLNESDGRCLTQSGGTDWGCVRLSPSLWRTWHFKQPCTSLINWMSELFYAPNHFCVWGVAWNHCCKDDGEEQINQNIFISLKNQDCISFLHKHVYFEKIDMLSMLCARRTHRGCSFHFISCHKITCI